MSKIEQAIGTIHEIDIVSGKRRSISVLHPLSRLFVVLTFLVVTMSFDKYDVVGLCGMLVYLIVTSILGEHSILQAIKRFRVIILLLFMIGIANPFWDTEVRMHLGTVAVSGGVLSFITLFLKGLFAVMASYFLFVEIGIEGICLALRCIHVPKVFVTTLLLTYRYIIVFLKEIDRMWQAYHLRAPKQRGIHIRVWGSYVGLLLIRSIDRAKEVYQCMLLRGYQGDFDHAITSHKTSALISWIYFIFWVDLFVVIRVFPVFTLVGQWLGF